MSYTPCQCEHVSHFDGTDENGQFRPATDHYYGSVEAAPDRRALHVGPICEACATGHYAGFLLCDKADPIITNHHDVVIEGSRFPEAQCRRCGSEWSTVELTEQTDASAAEIREHLDDFDWFRYQFGIEGEQ